MNCVSVAWKAAVYLKLFLWELIRNARGKLSVVVKNEMFACKKKAFRDVM